MRLFGRKRRTKIVLVRPASPWGEALSDEEIEVVREWSRAGMPTSAEITLGLIATLDRRRTDPLTVPE